MVPVFSRRGLESPMNSGGTRIFTLGQERGNLVSWGQMYMISYFLHLINFFLWESVDGGGGGRHFRGGI